MISSRNKTKESRNQAVANNVSKKVGNTFDVSQLIRNSSQMASQQKLEETANKSDHVRQLVKYQNIANSKRQVNENAALATLGDAKSDVVQRVITVNYSDKRKNQGRAQMVEANVEGETLPKNSNSPTKDPLGWTALNNKYVMDGYVHVRMHLWNGRLGEYRFP